MASEITLQQHHLDERDHIETIYFGGGTPSLLPHQDISTLLDGVNETFSVVADPEITLEANPDDLSVDKLEKLINLGITRLSIGIQSFDNDILSFLHRAHNAQDATRCVRDARAVGFNNISVDLIYAIPGQTEQAWRDNVEKAIHLGPEHISAYSLTIEDKTAFGRWASKGRLIPVEDDVAADQLELLLDALEGAGYDHYEISNFAKPGYYSRHNSSYWKGSAYLGIGPSAHSFDGNTRQSNVSNNHEYIRQIKKGVIPAVTEPLTRQDKINDYILTTLRTSWGTDLGKLKQDFGLDILSTHRNYIETLVVNEMAVVKDSHLLLTKKGRFVADKISADLFIHD